MDWLQIVTFLLLHMICQVEFLTSGIGVILLFLGTSFEVGYLLHQYLFLVYILLVMVWKQIYNFAY